MPDDDEYDALLEEPFGEDVDWTAVDGMAGPAGLRLAAAGEQAPSPSGSDEYFIDDEVLDESFLNEVRRLEDQAIAGTPGTNALSRVNIVAPRTVSSSRPFQPNPGIPRQNIAVTSSVASASSDIFPPALRRSVAVELGPRSSPSTHSTAQVNPPALEHPASSSVLANDPQTNSSLERPPATSATTVVDTLPSTLLNPLTHTSRQPSPRRKRRRSSACCSDDASPRPKAQCIAKQKASKLFQGIEKALECPICFDTIAAAHLFSCGHSACGLCLCEWARIKRNNTTCSVCRAPHTGPLIPNYSLDDAATTYFNEKSKISQDGLSDLDLREWKRWEERRAEGKAAVQKYFKKVAPAAPVVVLDEDLEDDAYDPYENDYYDYDELLYTVWRWR